MQDSSVLICPNLKFSDSGSKHLYFPHLKQSKMCLYNFQLAIQHSNKYLWWSSLVQQLTVWHQELHLRCLWESWICYYFTLQKFILESALDKLETMYKLETKYKHSFLHKKIAKVISKKFRLGCCFENVQRKTCGNRF